MMQLMVVMMMMVRCPSSLRFEAKPGICRIYMYIYICVCVYVCMYMYTYMHMYIRAYIIIIHIYIYSYIYIYTLNIYEYRYTVYLGGVNPVKRQYGWALLDKNRLPSDSIFCTWRAAAVDLNFGKRKLPLLILFGVKQFNAGRSVSSFTHLTDITSLYNNISSICIIYCVIQIYIYMCV